MCCWWPKPSCDPMGMLALIIQALNLLRAAKSPVMTHPDEDGRVKEREPNFLFCLAAVYSPRLLSAWGCFAGAGGSQECKAQKIRL